MFRLKSYSDDDCGLDDAIPSFFDGTFAWHTVTS